VTTIAIVTGTGRDADPWHHLPGTSAALADVLAPIGDVVEVRTDEDAVAAIGVADLVVVNAAADSTVAAEPERPEVTALLTAAERGAGVLGVHSSTLAFPADRRWAVLLGGRWERGTTFHPQIGRALIQLDPAHPLVGERRELTIYDERYSALEVAAGVDRLAFHTEDGVVHPLAWTRAAGRGRVGYWGPGHGVESYDDDAHRAALRSLATWLMAA
jgi:uncharacterized protein